MRILGIDAGTTHSGLVLFDTEAKAVVYAMAQAVNDRVLSICRNDDLVGGEMCYDEVVFEALSPQGQVLGHSTFDTIMWVGKLSEAAQYQADVLGIPETVHLIRRNEIKKRLLGRTNIAGADKHIRQVLVDQVGPKGTKREPGPTYGCSSHSWAALAAVWAHLHPEGV